MRAMPAALILLLAWSLFAFGAVYDWALWPAVVLAVIGALVTRRSHHTHFTALDFALAATVLVALAQLLPLPGAVRLAISPGQAEYFTRTSLAPLPADAWASLTLYPPGWLFGGGTLVAAIAAFVWTRDALDGRSVRRLARWIAWMGLAASALALIQPSLTPDNRVYGFWTPQAATASPAGPIISRNHFAAWLVLAWPLTVGYLISHARTHWIRQRKSVGVAAVQDTRAMWLVLAAALMMGGLLITRSRGGAMAFGLAVVWVMVRSWRRAAAGGRAALVGLLLLVAAAVSLWTTTDPLVDRFFRAYSGTDGGRLEIWAQSRALAAQFPIAGIGLGAFEIVMPAYQTSGFATLLNHAHNQYLHLLVEGGVLLTAPLGIAVLLCVALMWRRTRSERGPQIHLRDGACAGLIGLAAMCIAETPLLTPAVALLAAVTAGIATRAGEPHHGVHGEDNA